MKIRVINSKQKATKTDFIILGAMIVIVIASFVVAPIATYHPPSLKYTVYTGCIYDSYYKIAYCNPIKINETTWVDMIPYEPSKYLK